MIFKGIKFRKSRKVCTLPSDGTPYTKFGRVVPTASTSRGGEFIKTEYTWSDGGPVFATPVKLNGHSLTNMAYGQDGYMYLAKDGSCFVGSSKRLPS